MKNFLIILLILIIVGSTGYAVYYQVDEFNKKQEIASQNVTVNVEEELLDINSDDGKNILNFLDIITTDNQENKGLQAIFTNLEGENIPQNLSNDQKQNIIYYSALKNGLLKDENNAKTMCTKGCKSISKSDAEKIGTSFGLSNIDTIYSDEAKENDTYLYASKEEVVKSTISHNVSGIKKENTITLTDQITIQNNEQANDKTIKIIKYELNKQTDNQYTLNKIIIES